MQRRKQLVEVIPVGHEVRSTCLLGVALDRGQEALFGICLVVALRHEVEYPVGSEAGSFGALYRRNARLSKCSSPSMRLKPPTSMGRAYGVLAAAGLYAATSKRGCIAATAAARDSAVRAAVFEEALRRYGSKRNAWFAAR